jgi:hypothetical protein
MLPKVLKPQEMVKSLGSPEIDVLQVPQLGRNCPFQIVILKPQLLQERKLPQRRRNGPVQHVILQVPEKQYTQLVREVARSNLDDDNETESQPMCPSQLLHCVFAYESCSSRRALDGTGVPCTILGHGTTSYCNHLKCLGCLHLPVPCIHTSVEEPFARSTMVLAKRIHKHLEAGPPISKHEYGMTKPISSIGFSPMVTRLSNAEASRTLPKNTST